MQGKGDLENSLLNTCINLSLLGQFGYSGCLAFLTDSSQECLYYWQSLPMELTFLLPIISFLLLCEQPIYFQFLDYKVQIRIRLPQLILYEQISYKIQYSLTIQSSMSTFQTSSNSGATKPTSIKIEPWTEFPKQSYTIHTDQFCHEKPLVAKIASKGSRSVLNLKETVSSKDNQWKIEDDLKFWFGLPHNHSLYARFKSSGYLKLHIDHGIFQQDDKQWNLYSSFWSDRSFSKSSVRVGAAFIHPRYHMDNRLKVNNVSGSSSFFWYNRSLGFYKQSKFGLLSVVDLTNKVVQKNNILLGHIFHNKHEVFVRLENDDFRKQNPKLNDLKSVWDSAIVNYVGRLNQSTRVGVEASVSLKDNSLKKVEAVVHKILPEQAVDLKVKVNTKYDIAVLFKRALWGFEDLVMFSAGFGIKNSISKERAYQNGIQLDINV